MSIKKFYLCLLLSICCISHTALAAETWVGTWATGQQLVESYNNPASPGLANNTLRQIVHASLGGSRIRVHFSNKYSAGPTTINSAHIALSNGGYPISSSIDTGTDTALTFNGGSPSVTMAAGEEVYSDALDFDVPPLSNLTVSIYFGSDVSSSSVTGHPGSRTAYYLKTGNTVSDAEMESGYKTEHWYVLSRIDVLLDDSYGCVVALGDSITDGRGCNPNYDNRWPDLFAARLNANSTTSKVGVINQGIGGNGLYGGLGPAALDRFDHDVLEQPGVKWAIIFEGTNDIGSSGRSASDIITAYQEFITKAHAANLPIYGATITPFKGSGYYSTEHEAVRDAVNDWIRTSGEFDAVIDFAASVWDPADHDYLDSAYLYENDYLHINVDGYQAMVDDIDLALFEQPSAPDAVAGNMILLNDNGGWCWYQDEKIAYDPVGGNVLVSTAADNTGFGGVSGARTNDMDTTTFNLATGKRTRVVARDGYGGDDHNMGAFWIRPDGRYLHFYCEHYTNPPRTYYRVSTNPNDGSAWDSEQYFDWETISGISGGGNLTYTNIHYMSDEGTGSGRLYNIVRWNDTTPNIAYSDDFGATWNYMGKLNDPAASGYSNYYHKFRSNGVDRIDFIGCEQHPRNYNNSVFHGYIKNGKGYDSYGSVVDDDLYDQDAPSIEEYTPIFIADPTQGEDTYHTGWTNEMEIDEDGYPVCLYQTRYGTEEWGSGSGQATLGAADHRFFYARFDGSTWTSTELCKLGVGLHLPEQDYTGMGCIHPDDANVVYVSTQFDPRDDTEYEYREIFKGVTYDKGLTWNWTQITFGSTQNNTRPAIPKWDANNTAVVWTRGNWEQSSYENYDLVVVGLVEERNVTLGLVDYIDATESNTEESGGSPFTPTGPSGSAGAADDQWHEYTGYGNGGSCYTAGDGGTENAPTIKTTMTGLADGTYDVFAYFWCDPDLNWGVRGGFESTDMLCFNKQSSQFAEASQFSGSVDVVNGDYILYRVYIGRKEVSGGGSIDVYIDNYDSSYSGDVPTRTTYDGVGVASISDVEDLTPPEPNIMTWASLPSATSPVAITMTATTATDDSPPVQYYFECTTDGNFSSGWQTSAMYEAFGLNASTEYSFRAKARDSSPAQNETGWSTTESATTEPPDSTPPTPDPMTWASGPAATGPFAITMTASTATDTDSPPVEYYFECTNDGSKTSGWQSSSTYVASGLVPSTQYSFRVKVRDSYTTPNETGWSSTQSATTEAAPIDVEILGSWETGTSHAEESGTSRALLFIAHVEENGAIELSSVTYGGQLMTKVLDEIVGTTYRAYVVAYILDEAGIDAASGDTFVPTWSTTPDNVGYASVFLENVDQTDPVGASASNSTTTSNTLTTTALSTEDGDAVVVAATCGNTGNYTVNNSFTEALEHDMASSTGTDGYKFAIGDDETPSVTHSNSNRQVIVGFVVKGGGTPPDTNTAGNPNPSNGADNVSVSTSLSWDAPTAYTPTSYDVYFGTNPTTRSNPKYTVYTESYDPPGDLLEGTTYYWAVDSNDAGTIYAGDDWSFTTYEPIQIGDLVAAYIISQPLSTYYASACSYYGALVYSEVVGDTDLKNSVIAAFPSTYYTGATMPPEGSVDENVYGILPFELYRQTGDANYLTSAQYLADEEFNPPDADGLSPYSRFWVDDMYMIGSLQAQAYKSTGDPTYADRAVTQLLGYLGEVEDLQQSNGLFHHTLSAPFFWGRGNGWAAAAMTEVLLSIPEDDPNRPQLLSNYQDMMAGLVNYQDESGMWYQLLDMGSDPDNWLESSCSGMFVFALATGVKEGWLPEVPYEQAALDGWAALADYVDEQGRVLQVCTGTGAGSTAQYYFDRDHSEIGNPHGQAAVIWAAKAMYTEPNDTFTLNYLAGTGGSIDGQTPQIVEYGSDGNTVTAVAETGYHFVNWSDDSNENPRTDLAVTADISVTANFALDEYTVTINTVGNGSVSKEPNQMTYHYGDPVQLTANPAAGWGLDSWSGDLTGTANPDTLIVTGNMNVTATFATQFTLTVDVNGGSYVTVYPDKTLYDYGETVWLTARTSEGWIFDFWSGDANGTANRIEITMDGSKTITANYSVIQWIISGHVTEPDTITPVEGVSIDANNGGGSDVTDANGYYQLTVDYGWSGTVTPYKANYTFEPNVTEYSNVTGNQSSDYTAMLDTFIISGYVADSNLVPIEGVLVSPDSNGGPYTSKYYGGGSDTTDVNGYYEVIVDYNWSGNVVPSKYSYAFSPNSMAYINVTGDIEYQDYTGTQPMYKITGYVKDANEVPNAGVQVNADNGGGSDATDANGYYEVWVNHNWSGKVAPSKAYYIFEPRNMTYTDVTGDHEEQNYVCTLMPYKIAGYVMNECNVPIEGVLIDANGSSSDITVTDANGYYEVYIDYNWSGTVTPSKQYYTFEPNYMSYSNVLSDIVDQNYAAYNIYDLDCDGEIGFGDIGVISDNWLLTGPDIPGDLFKDEDDIVNLLDFAVFGLVW